MTATDFVIVMDDIVDENDIVVAAVDPPSKGSTAAFPDESIHRFTVLRRCEKFSLAQRKQKSV